MRGGGDGMGLVWFVEAMRVGKRAIVESCTDYVMSVCLYFDSSCGSGLRNSDHISQMGPPTGLHKLRSIGN